MHWLHDISPMEKSIHRWGQCCQQDLPKRDRELWFLIGLLLAVMISVGKQQQNRYTLMFVWSSPSKMCCGDIWSVHTSIIHSFVLSLLVTLSYWCHTAHFSCDHATPSHLACFLLVSPGSHLHPTPWWMECSFWNANLIIIKPSVTPQAFKINLSSLEYLGFLLSLQILCPWTLSFRYMELQTKPFHASRWTDFAHAVPTGIAFPSFCRWQCLLLPRGFPLAPSLLLSGCVFSVPCMPCQHRTITQYW